MKNGFWKSYEVRSIGGRRSQDFFGCATFGQKRIWSPNIWPPQMGPQLIGPSGKQSSANSVPMDKWSPTNLVPLDKVSL